VDEVEKRFGFCLQNGASPLFLLLLDVIGGSAIDLTHQVEENLS